MGLGLGLVRVSVRVRVRWFASVSMHQVSVRLSCHRRRSNLATPVWCVVPTVIRMERLSLTHASAF